MDKNFLAVRGAITVDSNTAQDITNAAVTLTEEVFRANNIEKDDVISLFFTLTDDLNKASPASAVRHAGLVSTFSALFCMQEAKIQNGLPMCLRLLANAKSDVLQRFVRHVYLEGAASLRPDLGGTGHFQIAIDGPSGAGKTTVANLVAKRMNISYLDTGAVYRAVAVAARDKGVDPTDAAAAEKLVEGLSVSVKFVNKKQRMYVGGADVTDRIREHSVSKDASDISAHMPVRELVTKICQETAKSQSIVMEGRDICGYVLPDADIKIYLDAAVEVRAKRRYDELTEKGQSVIYENILSDIEKRDKNDMSREHAPLKKTDDAVYIDGSNLSVDEIFDVILGEFVS